MALAPGTHLGHYEILALLGAGGMGEVYCARDPRLDRHVAIKVLPAQLTHDPDALARFEREAKAVAALSHPNIVAIHHFATDGGMHFVVMELLAGETLRSRLGRSPLGWRKVVEIGIAIADGLAAAHAKGIIHRDLKPENIFLTSDGQVKILDFGLARFKRTGPSQELTLTSPISPTQPGAVMGTAGYMSPEQVRGEEAAAPSDIFAFGCVLYEMSTGRSPFAHQTGVETLAAILKDDPPAPDTLGRGIPPELERLIAHCLEKNPGDRFQSARDLAFDLRAISNTARAAARSRSPLSFWLALAVGVLVVALASALVYEFGWRRAPQPVRPPITSLAVLPLQNLSQDPEQDYFADGMTEALITDLSKIRALRLISRTSVMRYRGTKKSLQEIAGELNADAIVEGSVARAGQRVRITVQLIEAASDRHLWADSYDRDLRDVLSLQSEVARAVAREIRVTVTNEEQSRLEHTRPVNPEAHEAFLKGRFHWNKRTLDGLKKSIEYFQRAIAIDGSYAAAYSGLADAYAILGNNQYLPAQETYPHAKAAALSAVQLDDTLAEAHASLAFIAQNYDWDWARVEREYRRAFELNPSYAPAYQWHAFYLVGQGRHADAMAEIQRARELDPLSPRINSNLGLMFYYARDYDRAIRELEKAVELDPMGSRWFLGWAYLQKRMYDKAIAASLDRVRLVDGMGSSLPDLAYAYALAGRRAEARLMMAKIREQSTRTYIPPDAVALVHLALGDQQQALSVLEAALPDRNLLYYWLTADPRYDPLRSEPRFQALIRAMGLAR
jgi:serine/threonine protein kinase/tetratricopeptide (TPR) repeat protein